MHKHSRIVLSFASIAVLASIFLFGLGFPSANAQIRDTTALELSPSSFTMNPGENIILTATLTSDGNPLANKTIEFGATNGSVSQNLVTTNSEGKVTVTYTAPDISVRTSVTVTAHFAQTTQYKSSSASASGTIELRSPTSLRLSPPTFTIDSGENIQLTARLTSGGEPLPNKTVEFGTMNGGLDKNTETTDSEGKATVTYTAPEITVRTTTKVTSSFLGNVDYKASEDSSSGTIEVERKVPTVQKTSVQGASFAIPETLKDDITGYTVGVPDKVKDALPVPIPDTGFLLANGDNVLLVLSPKSDKGIANIEGWVLSKSLEMKEISLNVMVADTVSFEKEGTPVSVGEILSNPDKYRLDLVKVNAARRHVSLLYDPDDGSGIEFPVTSGYLVENPETARSFLRKAIERGKEIIRENGKPSAIKDVLRTERTRLPVFDFETDYWINSPAVTNGIVLPSGSQVMDILGKLTPALDRTLQLDNGVPVLYDVKTDLDYESVSSVGQIKENPEQFRGKVVGFTAKGFEAGISVQETWEEQPPCGPDKVQIPTPQGPVCIDILVDVRLEGSVAWNKVSVPPKRTDFLLTGGASSIHQDRPYKQIKRRFRFVGRVRSTKEIDNSLPESMALVIYDKKKIGDIDYRAMAERAKGIIENRIGELNFGLTGFVEGVPPEIPVKIPKISVAGAEELPETISIEKGKNLSIQAIKPETPVELKITKSAVDGLSISVKNDVSNVEINIEKQLSLPPEIDVQPSGEVYRSIDISVKNLPADSIENAGITFWVLKEWLSTHDFGKDDVTLQRFHAGGWENLPTEHVDENATHFKYSAPTSGFSTFAITAAETEAEGGPAVTMKLRSKAFEDGESIPVQYTADGKNISPPITVEDVPDQAKSLALITVDLDAPGGKFTHWVIWNMPADIDTVPEDVPKEKVVRELGGASQGKNGFGEIGYGGPSPPKGSSHRYKFTLYALDKELELSAGATKEQLMDRMKNRILQKSELVGVYKRAGAEGGFPWPVISGIVIAIVIIGGLLIYLRRR